MKLSRVSKLDGIRSWSLTAFDDCPGSRDEQGDVVPACQGCYARGAMYHMKKVKAVRHHNRDDWQRDQWVPEMIQALSREKYFRWFDSGDMYALELAQKMLEVMRGTPNCRHWLPTRMARFAKFQAVIQQMQALPNVMVRFSSDSIQGEFTPGVHGSTIIATADAAPAGVKVCEAYEHHGRCMGCRACYSRDVPVIAYVAHGRTMKRIIRLQAA